MRVKQAARGRVRRPNWEYGASAVFPGGEVGRGVVMPGFRTRRRRVGRWAAGCAATRRNLHSTCGVTKSRPSIPVGITEISRVSSEANTPGSRPPKDDLHPGGVREPVTQRFDGGGHQAGGLRPRKVRVERRMNLNSGVSAVLPGGVGQPGPATGASHCRKPACHRSGLNLRWTQVVSAQQLIAIPRKLDTKGAPSARWPHLPTS